MKTFPDFENELKAIDSRLTIIPNPNRKGLANIKLEGRDVCPIPSEEIFDEPDEGYRITFPNGWEARHKSRLEALARVNSILELIKTPDGSDQFFGRGDYA
jgi:hypothetical protein